MDLWMSEIFLMVLFRSFYINLIEIYKRSVGLILYIKLIETLKCWLKRKINIRDAECMVTHRQAI